MEEAAPNFCPGTFGIRMNRKSRGSGSQTVLGWPLTSLLPRCVSLGSSPNLFEPPRPPRWNGDGIITHLRAAVRTN